jgi:hypothetical protein
MDLVLSRLLLSLNSADAKWGYRHAVDEFVNWYCPEPQKYRRLISALGLPLDTYDRLPSEDWFCFAQLIFKTERE